MEEVDEEELADNGVGTSSLAFKKHNMSASLVVMGVAPGLEPLIPQACKGSEYFLCMSPPGCAVIGFEHPGKENWGVLVHSKDFSVVK